MRHSGPRASRHVAVVVVCLVATSACLPSPPMTPPAQSPALSPPATAAPVTAAPATTPPTTVAPTTTVPAGPAVCGAAVNGSSAGALEPAGPTGTTSVTAASSVGGPDVIDAQEIGGQTVAAAQIATATGADGVVVTAVDADGQPEFHRIDAPTPATAAQDAQQLEASITSDGGSVIGVEPDTSVHVSTVNDPARSNQWALTQLDFEGLWQTNDGTGVCVAVIDTGVQTTHPDLAGLVVGTADFTGEGPADGYGHGTHVAGIIGAVANNGVGLAGAAPGVDLLSVKVLASTGSGLTSWVADGITWAVDHGARVINLSLGASCPPAQAAGCQSTAMQTAVTYAQDHDVVVVAAAGNDGDPAPGGQANPSYGNWSWPAAFTWPIAVASTTSGMQHSPFSTAAAYVDVSAPGSSIYSTYLGSIYGYMSGTSMATPYVAALAALLRGAHPSETATQIKTRITSTATDLGTAGLDPVFGWGLINPPAATAG